MTVLSAASNVPVGTVIDLRGTPQTTVRLAPPTPGHLPSGPIRDSDRQFLSLCTLMATAGAVLSTALVALLAGQGQARPVQACVGVLPGAAVVAYALRQAVTVQMKAWEQGVSHPPASRTIRMLLALLAVTALMVPLTWTVVDRPGLRFPARVDWSDCNKPVSAFTACVPHAGSSSPPDINHQTVTVIEPFQTVPSGPV